MKAKITSIMPSGHGHKEVTIQYTNGKEYSAVTNNVPLIDAYNSDSSTVKEDREKKRATNQLIRMVKDENNLR